MPVGMDKPDFVQNMYGTHEVGGQVEGQEKQNVELFKPPPLASSLIAQRSFYARANERLVGPQASYMNMWASTGDFVSNYSMHMDKMYDPQKSADRRVMIEAPSYAMATYQIFGDIPKHKADEMNKRLTELYTAGAMGDSKKVDETVESMRLDLERFRSDVRHSKDGTLLHSEIPPAPEPSTVKTGDEAKKADQEFNQKVEEERRRREKEEAAAARKKPSDDSSGGPSQPPPGGAAARRNRREEDRRRTRESSEMPVPGVWKPPQERREGLRLDPMAPPKREEEGLRLNEPKVGGERRRVGPQQPELRRPDISAPRARKKKRGKGSKDDKG